MTSHAFPGDRWRVRLQCGHEGTVSCVMLEHSCCERCLSRSLAYVQYSDSASVRVPYEERDLVSASVLSGLVLLRIVVFAGLPARTCTGFRYDTMDVE